MAALRYLALVLAAGVLLTACDAGTPVPPGDLDADQIVAPQGFDFATSQEVHVRIASRDADGASIPDAPFTLLDSEGRTLVTGFTDDTGAFDLAFPMSSGVRDVTLRVDGRDVETVSVASGRVDLTFEAPADAPLAPPGALVCPGTGRAGSGEVKSLVFYPGQDETATLAFEDQWPGEGDYDFNDLVLDYNFCFGLGNQSRLRELDATFTIAAVGGSYRNGFGFQIPIPASKTKLVTQSVNGSEPVTIGFDEAASTETTSTVIAFTDATTLIGRTPGSYANTDPAAPYLAPPQVQIHVESTSNDPLGSVDINVLNPFLIVNGERGREIHLAGGTPTPLADPALFGTQDDTSAPGSGRSYVTANNLPWALNLSDGFAYAVEKAPITEAYIHFADWATSGGAQFADWYTNPAYRNAARVYSR